MKPSRLTENEIAKIRESLKSGVFLAKLFGVSESWISRIRNKKSLIKKTYMEDI